MHPTGMHFCPSLLSKEILDPILNEFNIGMHLPAADPGFPRWGFPKGRCQPIIWPNFTENCMKIKNIGLGRGGIQNFAM